MTFTSLIWGSPQWMAVTLALIALATGALLWNYMRAQAKPSVRMGAAVLKALGFIALAISLLEPLITGSKPRRGANAFVILADNSQSLKVRDGESTHTSGDWMRELLRGESAWKTRLGQEYDVRSYMFDSHLRAVDGFEGLTFDGTSSALAASLDALSKRFRDLPLAGVLLFTDGNRTDAKDLELSHAWPIYPVIPPSRSSARDVGVSQISINQTNFESAPVVIKGDVSAIGLDGETIVAVLADESDQEVERQLLKATGDGSPLGFRFQFRPAHKGVSFYHVKVVPSSDLKNVEGGDAVNGSTEQTLANNSRLVVVDQGSGPYRVLYVSGRPNWEFKFLRRAIEEEKEVELIGQVRIARRQPKFDFRSARTRTTSPLFDGFDHPDAETVERQDQPVLIRLGTHDKEELRDGFPRAADELYKYHAVIIDDLEATFFTPDQQALLRNFVSRRGGGFLMLGGPDSFVEGKYDKSLLGELLPVYVKRASVPEYNGEYRLVLTREGWLQPWVRLRKNEDEENKRLTAMSAFQTLSRTGNIKPGAVVLSEVEDANGVKAPALVAQSFGKGHVAALLIGDLWRWGMHRQNEAEDDFERSWRQTVRWLVSDVPSRVELTVRPMLGFEAQTLSLWVRVCDAEYRPLDNAKVAFRVGLPGGGVLTLDAEPDAHEAGAYTTTYVPRVPGAYRIVAVATSPEGSVVGEREAGWAAQPATDEFACLEPDREYLKSLASKSGGEVIDGERLSSFVASLSTRSAPITEPWTSPLWHQPLYFLIAIACLIGEWGLRRINGLA